MKYYDGWSQQLWNHDCLKKLNNGYPHQVEPNVPFKVKTEQIDHS